MTATDEPLPLTDEELADFFARRGGATWPTETARIKATIDALRSQNAVLREDDEFHIQRAYAAEAELATLRNWKEEATEVLNAWEQARPLLEELGYAQLGQSVAESNLRALTSLREERDRLRGLLAQTWDGLQWVQENPWRWFHGAGSISVEFHDRVTAALTDSAAPEEPKRRDWLTDAQHTAMCASRRGATCDCGLDAAHRYDAERRATDSAATLEGKP